MLQPADFTQHGRRCIGRRNLRDFRQSLLECRQFKVEVAVTNFRR